MSDKIARYFLTEIQSIKGVLSHKVYDRKTGEHFWVDNKLVDDEFINEMILKSEMAPYKPTPSK